MERKRPDVMLLGAEWPQRALLRAQLIEEGHEVVAIDDGPIPKLYRRPKMKPRTMIVDLQGLPHPRETLDAMRLVLQPERVLVLTALGSLPGEQSERSGSTSSNGPPRSARSSQRRKHCSLERRPIRVLPVCQRSVRDSIRLPSEPIRSPDPEF
jgi:hypothetical protein